jgi:hypothetical protein
MSDSDVLREKSKADVEHAFGRRIGGCREDTRIHASAEIDGEQGEGDYLVEWRVSYPIRKASPRMMHADSVWRSPNKRPPWALRSTRKTLGYVIVYRAGAVESLNNSPVNSNLRDSQPAVNLDHFDCYTSLQSLLILPCIW